MNYEWYKRQGKAMQALKTLPESEEFILFCGTSAFLMAHNDTILVNARKMVLISKKVMDQIAAEKDHYKDVAITLKEIDEGFEKLFKHLDLADKANAQIAEESAQAETPKKEDGQASA